MYYPDVHKLGLLDARIKRLEKSLERIETIGVSSVSSAGVQKTFLDPHKIKREIDRCIAEYDFIATRLNHGTFNNKQIKKVIYKNETNPRS
jgi:predicted component of type VI protein secretion system